jgi:hypothetical protein
VPWHGLQHPLGPLLMRTRPAGAAPSCVVATTWNLHPDSSLRGAWLLATPTPQLPLVHGVWAPPATYLGAANGQTEHGGYSPSDVQTVHFMPGMAPNVPCLQHCMGS